jgi:hypothetical protein
LRRLTVGGAAGQIGKLSKITAVLILAELFGL